MDDRGVNSVNGDAAGWGGDGANCANCADPSSGLTGSAVAAVALVRKARWWQLPGDAVLAACREVEVLARLVYALQVELAGELDQRKEAGLRSCSSTAALLRQVCNISNADAVGRVKAARAVLPTETLTGQHVPPVLPQLAAAVTAGQVGPEHIRTVLDTMNKVPAAVPRQARQVCEAALVDMGRLCDPNHLDRAAARILEIADPDGQLDDTTPAQSMGLNFGGRNTRTGLTPIKGLLDDEAVETVKKAIDGLSAPQPSAGGVPDPRTPANRRAHALTAALRGFLDAGTGPTHGGERPHLTVILNYDAITGALSDAGYDTGGHLSPVQARRYLCDAQLVPAVLGSAGEILDVGRATRTFPLPIRRAIAARDRGCIWPGCDRPPDWCDGHHIQYWSRDFGATSLHNGVLLCPYHHTQIHHGHWQIRKADDGIPELIPPTWIDPDQRPRRNHLHHFTTKTRTE